MVKRGEWLKRNSITAKEKIMLHLLETPQPRDLLDVPMGLTQEGIGESTGIRVNHVSRAISQLKSERLVTEASGRVRGQLRKRNVYGYTENGYILAQRIREEISKKKLRIRNRDSSITEAPIIDLSKLVGARHTLTRVIRDTDDEGILDIAKIEPRPSEERKGFYSLAEGLVTTDPFYGRKDELGRIEDWMRSSDRDILVIRGAEGMGKSSLAGEAFSRLRTQSNLFWYSFRQWDSPETVVGMLSSFLGQLGKPGLGDYVEDGFKDLRSTLGALAKRLEDTPAILFFDDLTEMSSELATFLYHILEIVERSADVRAILISQNGDVPRERELLARGAVRDIALAGLDKKSCKKLLTRKMGKKEFERIFRLTEGHPLSFKLISTKGLEGLGGKKDYTPEELAVIRYMNLFEEP